MEVNRRGRVTSGQNQTVEEGPWWQACSLWWACKTVLR